MNKLQTKAIKPFGRGEVCGERETRDMDGITPSVEAKMEWSEEGSNHCHGGVVTQGTFDSNWWGCRNWMGSQS